MRNISDNGLKFTAAFEHFRGTAYKATKNEKYWTIGFGHYGPDVKEGQKITEGQGLILLNKDMAAAVKAVDAVAHPSLTQAQFDAVVDLVFNAGPGVIAPNTGTGQALRAGDVKTLRAKLALFINQNGKPVLGLRRRVAGRLALFDGKPWQEAEKIGRAVN
ncbi:TPA: lysozyme [Salmonella enterica subsp. enterica serovar Infantis]|nr:lysozyme [Salmonella enterica subsp. enterica serovar Infantis]HCI4149827.1 lysozyme [Salmonella enterica subsp. enterica serovar Infantis]